MSKKGKKGLSQMFGWLSDLCGLPLDNYLDNWLKGFTGSGMNQRDSELADTELENTRQLQEEEFERKEQWYQKYESPAAMARQYEEAGLNKMMLAGGGASVSASGGVGSAGSASAPSSGPAGDLGSLIAPFLQLGRFKLERNEIRTRTLKMQEEANTTRIENHWRDKMLEAEYNERIVRTHNIEQNTIKLVHDSEYARILALFAPSLIGTKVAEQDANAEKALSDVKMNASNIELNESRKKEIASIIAKNSAEVREMNKLIEKMDEEIRTLVSQSEVNDQSIEESKKRCVKLDEEIKLIGKQIGLTEKETEFYIWNHPRSSNLFGVKWNTSSENGRTTKRENSEADMVFLLRQMGYSVEKQ